MRAIHVLLGFGIVYFLAHMPREVHSIVDNTPSGWLDLCKRVPGECVPRAGSTEPVVLTEHRWQQLVQVNRHFNRTIKGTYDHDQFGVEDRWTFAENGKGDCEDYALAKRRHLEKLGWPRSALLITLGMNRAKWGDRISHAVLVVNTTRGMVTLDNQLDTLLLWQQTGYELVVRQSVDDPNVWVRYM